MSLDALKQVSDKEQATGAQLAEATAAAKKRVAEAERAGKALVEQRRGEAQAEMQALMKQTVARGEEASREAKAGTHGCSLRIHHRKGRERLKWQLKK